MLWVIYNLRTNEVVFYDESLSIREALFAAHEYGRGQMNTWEYVEKMKAAEFMETEHHLVLGNWVVRKPFPSCETEGVVGHATH
jgi:hypothetical protein